MDISNISPSVLAKLDKAITIIREKPEEIVSGAEFVTKNADNLKKGLSFVEKHGTIAGAGANAAKIGGSLIDSVGTIFGFRGAGKGISAKADAIHGAVEFAKNNPKMASLGLNLAKSHGDVINKTAKFVADHNHDIAGALELMKNKIA